MSHPHRRSAVVALLMATVSACAGAGRPRGPEPGAAPGEIIVTGPGSVYHVPLSPRTPPRTRTLARAAAAAWAAIPGAYAAAGIPVTLLDADGLQAGAIDLEVRGALGSTQVSAYLDCGIVAGALPAADRFLVTMTVLTTLRPLGSDSTDARIVVAGTARDATGTNPARVCASTGRLERALLASIEGAPQGMAAAPAGAAVGRPPGGAPAGGEARPPAAVEPGAAAAADSAAGAGRVEPARRQAAPARPAAHSGQPLLLAAGGAAGGFLGVGLGRQIGKDCETRCLTAHGTIGPLVVGGVLIPLGVHLANRGRGDLVKGLLVSAAWATAAGMVAGLRGESWPVYAVAPGQLLTSLLIERATTAR